MENDTTKSLIKREWNGHPIGQRHRDGYANATAMCKATGKKFAQYMLNLGTKEFLAALSAKVGIPTNELIQSFAGAPETGGGSWVHPQVAINLAQWCSAEFAVQVTEWVLEIMQGDRPKVPDAYPDLAEKIAAGLMPMVRSTLQAIGLVSDKVEVVDAKVNAIDAKVDAMGVEFSAKLGTMEQDLLHALKRNEPTKQTTEDHYACAFHRFGGWCPACGRERVTDGLGRPMPGANIDHFSGRHRGQARHTWPVCRGCNVRFEKSPMERMSVAARFSIYQETLERFLTDGPQQPPLFHSSN